MNNAVFDKTVENVRNRWKITNKMGWTVWRGGNDH